MLPPRLHRLLTALFAFAAILLLTLPRLAAAQTGTCAATDAPAAVSGGTCSSACAMNGSSWECFTTTHCVAEGAIAWIVEDYAGNGTSDYSYFGECAWSGITFCCAHLEQSGTPVAGIELHGTEYGDFLAFHYAVGAVVDDLKPARPDDLVGTIWGYANQEAAETITGSDHDSALYSESLYGMAGADTMYGLDGGELLDGGLADDFMDGGPGADKMYGGSGDDEMHGGYGADVLKGDENNDLMYGDEGPDSMDGGLGADAQHGGDDHDTVCDNVGTTGFCRAAGDDLLDGGDGNDRVWYGGTATCPLVLPNASTTGGLGIDACGDANPPPAGHGASPWTSCSPADDLLAKPPTCPP